MDETQDPSKRLPGPSHTPKGGVRLADLAKKRAQNLRDNLARRKTQTRSRLETPQDDNSSDR